MLVAFRCDGGERLGAGHVARCLPLAGAFAAAGHRPVFCGAYDGLAAWLIAKAGHATAPATKTTDATAAVVDLYEISEADLCALAATLPICTIAEAVRCQTEGIHLDFHADRANELPTERTLPGPAYAPIDPKFAQARRDRTGPVQTVLVTLGASGAGRALAETLVPEVRAAFPSARIVTAGALDAEGVERLPSPSTLAEHVHQVDVAVSAAGHTAYELACAAVPTAIFALADNQERVVNGALRTGFAHVGPPAQLRDPELRSRLQQAGPRVVDGHGAARAATALAERWGL